MKSSPKPFRVAGLGPPQEEAWDALAAANPSTGFMQSWAWSRFKEWEGYGVLRIGIWEGGRLAGGAIAYAWPAGKETLVSIPDGPVLDWNDPLAPKRFDAIRQFLRRSPLGRDMVTFRVEPRLPEKPAWMEGFSRAPVDLVPWETYEVPLTGEAAMLARMKPKTRYNIRLAERYGVETVDGESPSDVHEFYEVFAATALKQGFDPEPKSFFINAAQSLFPRRGRFVFARHKGMTLAAALVVTFGTTTTYLYGGHLPFFGSVMANYALHWAVLRRGAREACRTYDLYGFVEPGHSGHPYDSFSRFKEKWGGSAVRRMGAWDFHDYDRLADRARALIEKHSARNLALGSFVD